MSDPYQGYMEKSHGYFGRFGLTVMTLKLHRFVFELWIEPYDNNDECYQVLEEKDRTFITLASRAELEPLLFQNGSFPFGE